MIHILSFLMIILFVIAITVPLSKKLRIAPVTSYLLGGVLLTPLSHIFPYSTQDMLSISHFGITLMMLLVGLEISPYTLRQQKSIFLFWAPLQVIAMILLFWILSLAFPSLQMRTLFPILVMFSFSSTALVIKLANDFDFLSTSMGKSAITFLLFQDIIAIFLISFLPILSNKTADSLSFLDFFALVGKITLCFVIFFASRKPLKTIFRFALQSKAPEVLPATSFGFVLAISILMEVLGLSWELGAFIAGITLSQSDCAQSIKTQLYPYKAILMAFFFIVVGMKLDFLILFKEWPTIFALTSALVLIKFSVFRLLAKAIRLLPSQRNSFGILLAQGSEFAFFILTKGETEKLFAPPLIKLLTIVITLSIFVTPPLLKITHRKKFL